MVNLETPIRYGEGEGLDRVKEGDLTSQRMEEVRFASVSPLYHDGSRVRGITSPSLYPNGLGDPVKIAAFPPVNEMLDIANATVNGNPGPFRSRYISVHSGFLSPRNQFERWKILEATRSKKNPWEEILAGRFADSAGSVAVAIEDDAFRAAYEEMKSDNALVNELSSRGDAEALIKELIMYRANNGTLKSVKVDVMTATSVHNLGHSVNVGIYGPDEKLVNMGIGIDIPQSPVQQVDFFENNGPKEYEAAIEAEPLLREFVESMGVSTVNEVLTHEIRDNRRELFNAMTTAGFGSYRGEQGHFTAPALGGMPSRAHAYAEARKFGYQID